MQILGKYERNLQFARLIPKIINIWGEMTLDYFLRFSLEQDDVKELEGDW